MLLFIIAYQPGGQPPISSTNKRVSGKLLMPSGKEHGEYSQPRALLTEEIPKVVNDFRLAARNAIRAGMSTKPCTTPFHWIKKPKDNVDKMRMLVQLKS